MATSTGTDELTELTAVTYIYDNLYDTILASIRKPSTWNELLRIARQFFDKNDDKLNTNIVGRQVLINQATEDSILDALGLNRDIVKDAINSSSYFQKTFGRELKLINQLVFGFPLILTALGYHRLGKQDASEICYLLTFFKPYASRSSLFWKYDVDEGRMLYTVEKSLSGRFDLVKYGTIMECMVKMSNLSYENYITPMSSTEKMTDKKLYDIYTSGVASRVNSFLGAIYKKYMENAGKSINFDASAQEVYDDDNDTVSDYEDADIQSDAAMKTAVINKVINKMTNESVDVGLIKSACATGFKYTTRTYTDVLQKIVQTIVDKMFDKMPEFFSCLIGSFLFHIDPKTEIRYTMRDFKSPIFLSTGIDILAGKKSNLKDKNMLRARELLNEMLSDYNGQYLKGETYNRNLKTALGAYWVFLIRRANQE